MALIGVLSLIAVSGRRWTWLVLAFAALGILSGLASAARTQGIEESDLPSGRVDATILIAEDATNVSYGLAVAEIRGLWGSTDLRD